VQKPPFPDTPGKWLSCYRYRWQPEGKACSPEHLGSVLGVSGTTVRRWEAGQLRPTRQDLSRFAATCELTALEESFLMQAFQVREQEAPPSAVAFERMAVQALQSDQPALLMDSLFYLRARNAYMRELVAHELTSSTNNAVMDTFGPARVPARNRSPLRLLRSFWFATAGLNVLPPFRRLLSTLQDAEGFEEAWWRIATTRDEAEEAHNLPGTFSHPEHGEFRVYMTRITVPPVYYLREYVPVDATATAFVERMKASVSNDLEAAEPHHWAFQE
jgi:transcriptional regulator with XRE-family HTH domain